MTKQKNIDRYLKKSPPGQKVLIITACSKKKLDKPTKAVNLYQGQFYNEVKKFSDKMDYDLMVLSAKHGLVKNKVISPYNVKLETRKQVKELQKTEVKKLAKLTKRYDKIIFLMGKKYSSVFEEFNNPKIIKASDKRGSGGFLQLIGKLNKMSGNKVKKMVKKESKVNVEILKKYDS